MGHESVRRNTAIKDKLVRRIAVQLYLYEWTERPVDRLETAAICIALAKNKSLSLSSYLRFDA